MSSRVSPVTVILFSRVLISFLLQFIRTSVGETYHVAFLGLDTPEAASVQLLYADQGTLPTATTRHTGCETLDFNNEITYVLKPCLSDLFPQGSNVFDSRAVKIEATTSEPVHVNVKHKGADEGFLAIPDDELGNEYYIATFCRFGGYCQFSVTPVEDGTSVMVRFPVTVSGAQVCISGVDVSSPTSSHIPFLLDEFDVLQFESTSDLTGTYITSNKKIAVFAGARNVPSGVADTVSHIIEQLPPVNKWGTDFIVVPNKLNHAGDEFIIVSSAAATKVEISGFSPFVIPYAGQFVTRRIDWEMFSFLEASSPVLVVQVMSIDLYNDSTSVQGNPSLILVQSVDHWVHSYIFNIGENPDSNRAVFVAVVAVESAKSNIQLTNPISSDSWKPVANTVMWTATAELSKDLQIIKDENQVPFGLYGYFGRSRASLIHMNWTQEAKVCRKSAPAPGDGVDNNCNGETDEDTCTEKDLLNSFTLNSTTQRTVAVGGLEYIIFTVRTCGLVFVTLASSKTSTSYFLVEFGNEHIHAHICDPECDETPNPSQEKTITQSPDFDCSVTVTSFWISWSNNQLKVDEGPTADPGSSSALSLAILEIPETLTFSTVFENAEINTVPATYENADILSKDCGKILSGTADTQGKVFYVPVEDTDADFTIMVTPTAGPPIAVKVLSLGGTSLFSESLAVSETLIIAKADLSPTSWGQGVRIEATGGETLVYVIRKDQSTVAGFHVLPKDILGTRYMVAKHAETTSSHETTIITMDYDASVKLGDQILTRTKQSYHTQPGDFGLTAATKPVAVFSASTIGVMLTQMPPIETLNRMYYVPAIDLSLLGASGTVVISSTEDSTYVIIKGAYDQSYEVSYAGDEVRRAVDDNIQMSIQSSKPILVNLYLEEPNGVWGSMITIPATEQYTNEHIFPQMIGFDFIISVAVAKDGSPITSLIASDSLSVIQRRNYTTETFSLTFLRSTTAPYQNAVFVIKSDEGASDINKVCRLSAATVGDGVDNDCDGLADEEYCYSNDIPGYIDYDIDGEFNEDCKEAGGCK